MPDSDVQVPPNSTGPLIDTTATQYPDGTTKQRQRVVVVDESNDPRSFFETNSQEAIAVYLRDCRKLLLVIAEAVTNSSDLSGLLEGPP